MSRLFLSRNIEGGKRRARGVQAREGLAELGDVIGEVGDDIQQSTYTHRTRLDAQRFRCVIPLARDGNGGRGVCSALRRVLDHVWARAGGGG
jgi:hypothetical protein